MRVDLKQYKAALEAVLFAVAEPISTDRLAELLEIEPQVVERLCEHLRDEYAESSHGIQLLCLEGDWQFATKPVFGDYVKAALDEANVDRFARYLQKFSKDTQFIVITHRKPTMEMADALFGVTMQEKGVSKMVSVKLSDVADIDTENLA